MRYFVQYRDSDNRLVKKTFKGKKRLIIYEQPKKKAKTEKVYQSNLYRKKKAYWERKTFEQVGEVAVSKLVKEEPAFKNVFVYGKKYDKRQRVFYDTKDELKKKHNAVVGYFEADISGIYPDKRKPVIIRQRVYFRKGDKRTVLQLRSKMEEIGTEDLRDQGYRKIVLKGVSCYNWRKRKEGRDLFYRRLVKFRKSKK